MLNIFCWIQWFNEREGDWKQQINIDLEYFSIPCDLDFIRSRSKTVFKQMVKIKAREFALNRLKEKQNLH